MNSDQLNLFDYPFGASFTVPVTSISSNGNREILEVHIFDEERTGILALVITSTFSLIAASGLLLAIASSWWNTRKSKDPHLFVRTGVAPYFVSMLVCGVFQSVGSIMKARWVQSSSVHVGAFCTSQAVIKHVADIGVAIWMLPTTQIGRWQVLPHTLSPPRSEADAHISVPRWASFTTLICANTVVVMLVCLGPTVLDSKTRGPFYGISGYWCWITDEYKSERITMDYMIMFLSAILSFIFYTLVFLRMRGNIVVDGSDIRLRLAKSKSPRGRLFAQSYALKIARQMLLYLIAYTFLILPIAATRFCEWSGRNVPFTVTIFSDVVFLLSGTVNVLLFCATRRILPAQSVVPGWRGLFRLAGFTESNPIQDTEKSFACRGINGKDLEEGRIKIDNHIDNTLKRGESRDGMPNDNRGTVPDLQPVIPRQPLPALVREERKSVASEISEVTVVGAEDLPKKVW